MSLSLVRLAKPVIVVPLRTSIVGKEMDVTTGDGVGEALGLGLGEWLGETTGGMDSLMGSAV